MKSALAKRPYRQTARAAAAQATRERILKSFMQRMRESWFDEIRLEDLARDAGVTVQTVIRRFGGKEGLLEAMHVRSEREIRSRRAVAAGDLEGAVHTLAEDYETIGDLILRLLAQEDRYPALHHVADLGRAAHRGWVREAFAPWLEPLPAREAERRLDGLVVAMDVYVWKLLRRDMGRPIAEYQALVRNLILAVLGGGRADPSNPASGETDMSAEPKSFLFATWEGGGTILPMLAAAERLIRRGHDVRLMSDACNRAEVEAAGVRFAAWTRAPSRPDKSVETDILRDWEAPPGPGRVERVISRIMTGPALAYAEDLREALGREPADLVVSSEFLAGVLAACESLGQPVAVLTAGICPYPYPGSPPFGGGMPAPRNPTERAALKQLKAGVGQLIDSGLPALNAARAALGLAPLAHTMDQVTSAGARLLLGTSEAFDFPWDERPAHVRYVGPQIADPPGMDWISPWPADDARPLVLVGFSTTFQDHSDVLQRVLDAAADLPIRVLLTTGEAISPESLQPGPNAQVVKIAPHVAVMREAALVVTHGGHGTLIRALAQGLPMLVIPHGRDQDDNAVRVADRGAGLTLTPTASAGEIRAALERLLSEPAYRDAAERLGALVAHEAANSPVAEELEALAAARPRTRALESSA